MTPLPIAYPRDANIYRLATRHGHRYEWLVGESRVPAFVGGKGVLVTRSGVEIYPVTHGRSVYEWTDGHRNSTIVNANTGWDTRSPVLTDTTTHRRVKFTVDKVTGALEFPFTAGHDDTLTGGGRATHAAGREDRAGPGRRGDAHGR
jgi:hypothetical protein